MHTPSHQQEAHNVIGDYALWQGAAHPSESRRMRTVMRHGEPVKIIETSTPAFSQADVYACRDMFINRLRALLASLGDSDAAMCALRQTWATQGFDPEVIERAIAAYQAEEAALEVLARSLEDTQIKDAAADEATLIV